MLKLLISQTSLVLLPENGLYPRFLNHTFTHNQTKSVWIRLHTKNATLETEFILSVSLYS